VEPAKGRFSGAKKYKANSLGVGFMRKGEKEIVYLAFVYA
jgi:hypothetical protein